MFLDPFRRMAWTVFHLGTASSSVPSTTMAMQNESIILTRAWQMYIMQNVKHTRIRLLRVNMMVWSMIQASASWLATAWATPDPRTRSNTTTHQTNNVVTRSQRV